MTDTSRLLTTDTPEQLAKKSSELYSSLYNSVKLLALRAQYDGDLGEVALKEVLASVTEPATAIKPSFSLYANLIDQELSRRVRLRMLKRREDEQASDVKRLYLNADFSTLEARMLAHLSSAVVPAQPLADERAGKVMADLAKASELMTEVAAIMNTRVEDWADKAVPLHSKALEHLSSAMLGLSSPTGRQLP